MSNFYLVLCDLRWKQIEAITNLNSVSIDSLFVASTAHQILSIIQEIANYAARSHWIILVPQSTIDNWIRYFYNFWKSLFTMDHSFLNYSIWRAETENQSSLIELKLNPNQVDFLEIINKYYVMFCSEFLERISLLLFESHPISISKFMSCFSATMRGIIPLWHISYATRTINGRIPIDTILIDDDENACIESTKRKYYFYQTG